MLNVYSTKDQLCIASRIIDSKTNEIPTMQDLLKELNIKGCIITNDALNTQKDTVAAVIDGLADYVMPIKGNHPIFCNELEEYFDEKTQQCIIAGKPNAAYKKILEYKNGCSIVYEYFQTTDVKWYTNIDDWKKLHSICMRKKTIEKIDEISIEYQYYISSLFINIDLFSKVIKYEWQVENKLHWHLDVTFRQDKNTTLNKYALANLEIINKFCLGVLTRVKKYYNGISLKRIMGKLSANLENNFPELISFLVLSDGFVE
jgi:predicted transposase YbfD/YdcC